MCLCLHWKDLSAKSGTWTVRLIYASWSQFQASHWWECWWWVESKFSVFCASEQLQRQASSSSSPASSSSSLTSCCCFRYAPVVSLPAITFLSPTSPLTLNRKWQWKTRSVVSATALDFLFNNISLPFSVLQLMRLLFDHNLDSRKKKKVTWRSSAVSLKLAPL